MNSQFKGSVHLGGAVMMAGAGHTAFAAKNNRQIIVVLILSFCLGVCYVLFAKSSCLSLPNIETPLQVRLQVCLLSDLDPFKWTILTIMATVIHL